MDTLKAIWSWLTGLFNKTEQPQIVNAPESVATLPESAQNQTVPKSGKIVPDTGTPTESRIKKAAQTPADYDPPAGEETVSDRAKLMYEDMSYLETHPREIVTLIGTKKRPTPGRAEMIAFLEDEADYAEMARHYSNQALETVRESGTEFALTPEISKSITRAVQTEWGSRNPGRSTGMGMGQDGKQK